MNSNQCYDLLGLNPGASVYEIRNAYRRLALEYHPDKNISSKDDMKFKLITEAYQTLRMHNKSLGCNSNSVSANKTTVDYAHKKIRTWYGLNVLNDVIGCTKKIRCMKTIQSYLKYRPILMLHSRLIWKNVAMQIRRLIMSSYICDNSFVVYIGFRRLIQNLLKYLGMHS